jgi:CRISPR/Cas system CSM-associated protein Csm3 (group 7 of RAMP superfamily)
MTAADTAILQLTLCSATTFGRGDGVAGFIDREVEHDVYGFPVVRGRTLKGLLREAAAEVVFALEADCELEPEQRTPQEWPWHRALDGLFGTGGSNLTGQGKLHASNARLPWRLRQMVMAELQEQNLTPDEVLQSLTGIRRQTAMNIYGGPDHATLRSMRVILREVSFEAELSFAEKLTEHEEMLLAAAALNLRAAGTGRNRGRGWMRVVLNGKEDTQRLFQQFQNAIARNTEGTATQPQE